MTDSLDVSPAGSSPSLTSLQQEAQALRLEIAELKGSKAQLLQQQLSQAQTVLDRLSRDHLKQLEAQKQSLEIEVERLERRQERIRAEMRESFAGVSQDLAIRVQGFKDYLVSSLQDLALSAEQLELVPSPSSTPVVTETAPVQEFSSAAPQFATQSFQEETRQIRKLLDQYRNAPNYYGPPWQLRRTFEPVHAERVSEWFFSFGGRGALRSLSSRLQNILVASAAISILRHLYGNRLRTLILADSPERLGDWRRGLQDCLGISRTDFGPERGIVLFESPDSLAQRADRLVKADQLPLILIDEAEELVSLSMLQFPLWLAYAPEPRIRKERSSFDWFE